MPIGALPLAATLPGATAGATAGAGGLMGLLGGPVGIGLTLASLLAPSILGTTQIAPAAPQFDSGGAPPPLGGPSVTEGFQQKLDAPMDIAALVQQAQASANPQMQAPPVDEKSGFGDKLGEMFGGAIDGVDSTLQSPAKMLGLGLLGNVNGNLPGVGLLLSGLLGSGLFGNKK